MTSRQLVVASLKDLARQCLREQTSLKLMKRTHRQVHRDEAAIRLRIRQLKARIDRELVVSAPLLDTPSEPETDE